MNFYSYDYLLHSSNIANDILVAVWIIIALTILFYGVKYMRNRTNLRFRNVFFMLLAFAALVICIQIGHWQDLSSSKSQTGQTVQLMKYVSHKHRTPLRDIYSSSSTLANGMLIKAHRIFYMVNTNPDNSAYQLKQAHPANNQINYVRHERRFGLNIHTNLDGDQNLNVALKLLVGFLLFISQINLLGKGNLAPSNGAQQCENYMLGGIVGGIMYNQAITFLQFITIIFIWSVIIFGFKVWTDNSVIARKIFEGRPHVIINNGQINIDNALKNGLTAHDIMFRLRSQGIKNLSNIKRVVLEQNGQFSIDHTYDKDTTYPIIADGKIDDDVLHMMNKSQTWLRTLLKSRHCEPKDVFLAQIENGHLHLTLYPQTKNSFTPLINQYEIFLKRSEHMAINDTHLAEQRVRDYLKKHHKSI